MAPLLMMSEIPNPSDDGAQLMRLMSEHQRRIFGYIYTLVPDRHDAQDILQETSVVICKKFGQSGRILWRGRVRLLTGKCGGRGKSLRGRR